jgi:hypothetical protein
VPDPDPFRILVTGSRDWADRDTVYRALDAICAGFGLYYKPDEHGNTLPDPDLVTVVHGDHWAGADRIASDWCASAALVPERHPANWETHGRKAGFLRNREMVLAGADLCLAFRKGASKGTQMTIDLAKAAGIPVAIFDWDRRGERPTIE